GRLAGIFAVAFSQKSKFDGKNMRKLFALFLIVLLPQIIIAQMKPLVLTHVTVIDMTGASPKSDMTVIISGNLITALGKSNKVRVPKNAQVVDASGKFLIPGFWDMHVHLQETTPFPLFIANGVLGVRHMGGNLKQVYEWREQVRQGKLLAPRIVACGSVVESFNEPDIVKATTAAEGREAVLINVKQGADFIKVYNPSREAYFALVAEAKKQNIPFAGHVPIAVTSFEASAAGQRSFEHLGNILRSVSTLEPSVIEQRTNETVKPTDKPDDLSAIPARIAAETKIELETYDAEKANRLFAAFVKNKTWQVPTLATKRPLSLVDDGTFFNDARMKYITAKELEDWKPENNFFLKYRTPEFIVMKKKLYQKELELTGAMHKAGVPFMTGTDVPGAYTYPGFSLHDELALFVQTGFTPMAALQATTVNPAKYLNLSDKLGTIEKGKIAELILLDADPLANIGNTQRINAVVTNGQYLSKEKLQQLLADVEANAKRK
ncbi:MAG: amidohydrolase family protein, partial [Acidobacteriota bacterium]|nr:amidohydrolase family protein [Acidobacteriota bacterium]